MGEAFKDRMKRIRIRAGLKSQAAAAEAIGCERGTVSMWEAPSSPVQSVSSEWVFAAAKAYKVRPEWINDLSSDDDGWPWVHEDDGSAEDTPEFEETLVSRLNTPTMQRHRMLRQHQLLRRELEHLRRQVSQFKRPDPAILIETLDFLEAAYRSASKEFDFRREVTLFADVFEWITAEPVAPAGGRNLIDFAQWKASRGTGGRLNEGEDGGASGATPGAHSGRAAGA